MTPAQVALFKAVVVTTAIILGAITGVVLGVALK